jgi:Flp pilus assembly protein TadG
MAMIALLRGLARDESGAAAAELAFVTPFVLALMFGAVEIGNYFFQEHAVVTAVRDGARYAARQPFADYAGCTPSTTLITNTQNVTRTGQVASGGTPRLSYWTNAATITVTASCVNGTYQGVYLNNSGSAPRVTVRAVIPYQSVLGTLGLANPTLEIRATQQAAVTGI